MTYEMLPADPFGDVPIFADLPAAEQQDLMGDHGVSTRTGTGSPPRVTRGINLNPFATRPFGIRQVAVGYVSAAVDGDDLPIVHAATAEGDPGLARQPLMVSLDRFYVQEYPGLGPHQVLCTFTIGCLAKFDGQTGEPVKQDVTFGYSFPVGDREAAAINGMPLFRDLRISDGLYMWISCINTQSSGDDALLEVLAGDPFSKGLGLLAITNPVTTMLSSLVTGVAKHFLNASRDALVFKPLLGLQVAGETASGKLRAGSYVIAQAGAGNFQWADYIWKHSEGRVVHVDSGEELPFNYIVISVRRQPGAS